MNKQNKNIIILNESEKYLGDSRVRWLYENLYGQYGKDFEIKIKDNKIIIYGSIMIPYQYNELEVKIDEIYGNVIVDNYDSHIYGNLKTLKNFPTIIHGDFKCKENKELISLEGGPEIVDGDFICAGCKLTSMEHLPHHIGGNLYLYSNKIEDIVPLSKSTINGIISIQFNPCEKSKDYIEMLKRNKYKFVQK